MNGEVHLPVGTATATGMALLLPQMQGHNLTTLGVGIGLAAVGALLPDIDANGDSKAKKQFRKIMGMIAGAVGLSVVYGASTGNVASVITAYTGSTWFIGAVCMLTCCILGYRSGHRKYTHQLIGLVTFTVSCWLLIGLPLTYWFFFGFLSHQVVDMLNKRKIEWLYPIPKDFALYICYAKSPLATLIGWVSTALTVLFILMNMGINPIKLILQMV